MTRKVTFLWDGATLHQQGNLKWKKKVQNFHYSISILSVSESNLIDEPPWCPCVTRTSWWSCTGWLNLFSPWTNSWQRGVLILCSFLRLIIHSTASSCYRCPALHPCSSHWGLTLKKNPLLMVICPEGRRMHFGHFRNAATASLCDLYNLII